MLGYFTCTRNSVPSAHMHSLYLSKPSSKYTSPAELGMRVALNMTDPLRMMLFSCKGTEQRPVRITFVALASHPPSHTHKASFTGEVKFLTYSPELDVSAHFKLHSSAHDVDAFISTNDGFAVPFYVQVICSTTCDLHLQETTNLI